MQIAPQHVAHSRRATPQGLGLTLVEGVTGVIFGFVGWRYGLGVDALLLFVAMAFLIVIAIIDFEHRLVLNRVLVVALPVALVSALLWSAPLRDPVVDVGPQ